ncbi:helix-turn-helix domain-containing protein [Dolosicoccus paucivorans]|uniref:helix-turn-helix domain-containing protein n=1 Tax=Dolosicoccus paucivorans TaxID=84521 RepID=UPI00088D0DD1|nr:helix-turn-helix transcriptional regulator [Dolosicoccus paucivorans]SDI40280.1 DNA-binding transcriptional regulator, XRE-family HTH domain [Dolosicoccus paucivorans]
MVSIAELRARKGKMSQRELAEKLSVTQTTISNWEKNPESISGENLKKVALFFRVSTDELLGIKVGKNF